MRWLNFINRMICIAGLGCLGIGSTGLAQPPAAADPLANSARPIPHLSLERTTRRQFESIAEALARDDASTASQLLRQLWELPEDQWVGDAAHSQGLRHQLAGFLPQFPREVRTLLEQSVSTRTQSDYDQAIRQRDVGALVRMAGRYPQTALSRQAYLAAGTIAWDRGDAATAAAVLRRCLPTVDQATPRDRPHLLKLLLALDQAGDHAAANAVRTDFAAVLKQDAGRFAVPAEKYVGNAASSPSPVSDTGIVYPAMQSRWQAMTLDDAVSRELLDLQLTQQRLAGLHSLPATKAQIHGNRLLVRTYTGLRAFDLLTGQSLWECAAMSGAESLRERRSVDNPGFRDFKSQELYRYFIQNQVSGLCAADSERVYLIGDQFVKRGEKDDATAVPSPTGRLRNQIVACRADSGQLTWQTWTHDSLADVFFLSAPIVVGPRLYVLAESDSQLKLFVLHTATGLIDWQLSLASLKLDLQLHPSRRLRQVAWDYHDGILTCATGSGCVLAIDLLTRNYQWSYRYPSREAIPRTAARMGPFGDPAKVIPFLGWQRISLVRDPQRTFVASPESDSLLALNSATGERLWEQPRRDGLYLAGVCGDRVIVVGFGTLSAMDVASGSLVWERTIDRPSGDAVVRGHEILLPLESGPVLLIDAQTGRTLRGAQGTQPALGNLTLGNGVLVSQTATQVEVYGDWEQERQQYLARVNERPDDAEVLRQLTVQLRRGGEIGEIVTLLMELYRQQPNSNLRVQLVNTLLDQLDEQPERHSAIQSAITPLVAEIGETEAELRCRVRAHQALGDDLAAMRSLIKLAPLLNPERFETSVDRVTQTRSDRALQGTLLDLWNRVPEARRSPLELALEDAFRAARDANDPFGTQRFVMQFSHSKAGQHARLFETARVGIGWPLFRQELSLLELADVSDRQIAATALWKLAMDMNQRSFRHDAARYYSLLKANFADVAVDGNRSGREVVAALPRESPLANEITNGPADPWPQTKPIVSKQKGRAREPFLIPIPVDATPGSLLDRVNISLDNQAGQLVCQGDWYPGYWEIPLPKTRSPLRELMQTYQGWGIGQLLVLRLGTQLFGISLLDSTGEPNGRVVWTHELAEDLVGGFEVREMQNRQGLVEAEVVLFDDLGREIGQVCVMQPGYFCYRHRGQIVVVETATGRTVWRRRNVSGDLKITGDAESLYLIHAQDQSVETIRVLDGKTLQRRPWPYAWEARGLFVHGLAIVSENQKNNVTLRWVRLHDLKVLAEYQVPRISHRMLLDPETLAIFQQDRQLVWFHLRTGKQLGQVELDIPPEPDRLSRVHCWQDQHRWYVLPTAIPPYSALGTRYQIRSGHRQHRVKGTLHAIDRSNGQLTWKRSLQDVTIPLDQPRGTPVFVLAFRRLAAGITEPSNSPAPGQLEGVLQVLDRRNGQDLYFEQSSGLAPEFTVEVNLDDHWLDIHGVTDRLRIEFPSS